jgi:hypothetical protein
MTLIGVCISSLIFHRSIPQSHLAPVKSILLSLVDSKWLGFANRYVGGKAFEIYGTSRSVRHLIKLSIGRSQMSNTAVAGCFFGIAFAWCLLVFGILDYVYR